MKRRNEQKMMVLVACEESQEVCKAFRARGHEAYSCDLQECSGGHPEWHIKQNVLYYLNPRINLCGAEYIDFFTRDGEYHLIPGKWDLIVAHPPCTYLTSVGASRLFNKDHTVKDINREKRGWDAKSFFMQCLNADCEKIAVENPAPMRYYQLPNYTQIIEPYMFGDPWKKRTCLWLKGIPALTPTNVVNPIGCWTIQTGGSTCRLKLKGPPGAKTAKERSKTFPGIAKAMAEQWG